MTTVYIENALKFFSAQYNLTCLIQMLIRATFAVASHGDCLAININYTGKLYDMIDVRGVLRIGHTKNETYCY